MNNKLFEFQARIAVVCDNKEQFETYMKTHKVNDNCKYIYVNQFNLPYGTDFHQIIDLREVSLAIKSRLVQCNYSIDSTEKGVKDSE